MTIRFNTTLRNNRLDEITSFAGASATLKLLTGTQPSGGGAETTILATLTCSATAFAGAAAAGVLTLNAVTGATAVATGTATWFRIESAASPQVWVMDGSVTAIGGGGDMTLDDTSIVVNGSVALGGPNLLTEGNAP